MLLLFRVRNFEEPDFEIVAFIDLRHFPDKLKINVVATLPDLGSLARDIGGDNVSVTVLAKPTEDPHFVDARPSFVVALRSADVLIDGKKPS